MSHGLTLGLDHLQHEVDETAQILKTLRMDYALTVRLIPQLWVAILSDFDEPDDLVVAKPDDRVVDAPLIQSEPVIMRLAIWPHPKSITVDADTGPFAQPGPDVGPSAD